MPPLALTGGRLRGTRPASSTSACDIFPPIGGQHEFKSRRSKPSKYSFFPNPCATVARPHHCLHRHGANPVPRLLSLSAYAAWHTAGFVCHRNSDCLFDDDSPQAPKESHTKPLVLAAGIYRDVLASPYAWGDSGGPASGVQLGIGCGGDAR